MIDITNIKIPHGANVSDEELLADLRAVASKEGSGWLTEATYAIDGRFAPNTIRNRFGSWREALMLIGLKPEQKHFKKHLACPSKEALIKDLQATAKKLWKETITCDEYDKHGKYGKSCARNRFGKWGDVLKVVGLKETGSHTSGISKEQLLEAIYEAWGRLGRQPNTRDVRNKEVPYGLTTYINQFGSWRNTMIAFVDYVKKRKGLIAATPTVNPVQHKTGRTPSAKLRKQIFVRDNATCQQCRINKEKEPNVKLVIDHIIPYSKGGETVYENLQVLCRKCNVEKRNKILYKRE